MAIKKIEIRPKGTGDYADTLYPKTSTDMVIDEATGTTVAAHMADDARHLKTGERSKWDASQLHKITSDDGKSLQLPSGTDLNTVIKNGDYNGSNLLNSPTGTDWMYLEVFAHTVGTDYIVQRAISLTNSNPTFYQRMKTGGTWSSWSSDLFQSVVDGKNSLESAIESKGGIVSDVNNPPTFSDLVAGVNTISTGKKWARGSGTPSSGTLTISGLNFTPSIVVVKDVNLESTSNGNGNYSGLFIKNATLGSVYNIAIRMEQTTFINTTCNVNSNGFSFDTNNNSGHYWIAIE